MITINLWSVLLVLAVFIGFELRTAGSRGEPLGKAVVYVIKVVFILVWLLFVGWIFTHFAHV